MGVVVETLVGFIVMFKHGERFVHRSGIVAARWFGDVVSILPKSKTSFTPSAAKIWNVYLIINSEK